MTVSENPALVGAWSLQVFLSVIGQHSCTGASVSHDSQLRRLAQLMMNRRLLNTHLIALDARVLKMKSNEGYQSCCIQR